MSEELKECPNCGHIPAPYDWCSASDGWRGQVYCEKCEMRGPAVLGDRQAFVDAWNDLPRREKKDYIHDSYILPPRKEDI